MKITDSQIKEIAESIGLQYAHLKAFMMVESGNKGFDGKTGRLIIQFEPSWFKRKAPYSPFGSWSLNMIDVQSQEWVAFSDAFKINPDAAMESTSIGLPQIMGFHWKSLGYTSAGDMWDDFKVSEYNQVQALACFILNNKKLYDALLKKDWHIVASIYNGSDYQNLAKRIGREPYNISMEKAYNKYSEVSHV